MVMIDSDQAVVYAAVTIYITVYAFDSEDVIFIRSILSQWMYISSESAVGFI